MEKFIKVFGKITINMGKDIKSTPVETFTEDSLPKENQKEKALLYGKVEKFTAENGKMGFVMAQELGLVSAKTVLWESGRMVNLMDSEFMYIQMVIVMRVISDKA